MKPSRILIAASAAALLASCAKVSDTTKITGTVVPEGLDSVNITVRGQLDTLVPVTNGKFSLEIPTDVCAFARAEAGSYGVGFIPDGTPLTIVLDGESTVTSSYSKISVQERLNAFNAKSEELMGEFTARRTEIFSDETISEDQKREQFSDYYDSFMESFSQYNKDVLEANKDNFVAILALDAMRYDLEDEELSEFIASMAPALQEHQYVQSIKKSIDARLETGEGKMFKDFTIETVVGMTRSIPPQPKYSTVRFSDYVGKGKYVIVDFWSPWCGPCKREMPNIKSIYEKYKGKDFDVLSIAVWERQGPEVTINTANDLGMNWKMLNNAGSVPTDIYGIDGIPHIMLIGPDGTILRRGLYGEALAEAVAEYLE
ncbi:MAG: TlpA family protein disulfide reductase [Candidatus Cryptobacteroides sp.]